jgi:hypothetical protein
MRLEAAVAVLPAEAGVYAWWAPPAVFAALPGRAHPTSTDLRLLYIGKATDLRRRVQRHHLRRSGSSTLRRTLAGLLLESEGYQTTWTGRAVLMPSDEVRLTEWMHDQLRLNWVVTSDRHQVETRMIATLHPPLNIQGAPPGPGSDTVRGARAAFRRSARTPNSASTMPPS